MPRWVHQFPILKCEEGANEERRGGRPKLVRNQFRATLGEAVDDPLLPIFSSAVSSSRLPPPGLTLNFFFVQNQSKSKLDLHSFSKAARREHWARRRSIMPMGGPGEGNRLVFIQIFSC